MYLYLKSFFPEENFLWIFKKCYNYLNIIFAKAKQNFILTLINFSIFREKSILVTILRKIPSYFFWEKNTLEKPLSLY